MCASEIGMEELLVIIVLLQVKKLIALVQLKKLLEELTLELVPNIS